MRFKILGFIFLIVFLAGCKDTLPDQPSPKPLPSFLPRIQFSLPTLNIPSSVAAVCDSSERVIARGALRESSKKLLSLIKGSTQKGACADQIADLFLSSLQANAQEAKFTDRKSEDEVDFDLLIIGSGIHGVILARNVSLLHPDFRILVVDKSEYPAEHFNTYAFRINSPGLPENTNNFPRSPISINTYASPVAGTQEGFPIARYVWDQIIFNAFTSNAMVALSTRILGITKAKGGYWVNATGPGIFSPQRKFLVKKIVISGGLGIPVAPPALEQEWLQKELKKGQTIKFSKAFDFPRVISTELLFYMQENMLKEGKSVFNYFGNKKIAVLGAGDTGKVTMEFLTGNAPRESIYRHPKTDLSLYEAPSEIVWVNQALSTYAEFSSPTSGVKKRYFYPGFMNIFAGIDNSKENFQFTPIAEKAAGIKPYDSGVTVTMTNGIEENVDFVITSLGYQNDVDAFLRSVMPSIKNHETSGKSVPFQSVKALVYGGARFSPSIETVAQQLCIHAKHCDEIYVIGTAAEVALAVSEQRRNESITKNAHSIETLSPLTESFSHFIFEGK